MNKRGFMVCSVLLTPIKHGPYTVLSLSGIAYQ